MWLRILDFIGLTNLTNDEICRYYERARKLGSRETNGEEKERFVRLLERYRLLRVESYRCLRERVLESKIITALSMVALGLIFISFISIIMSGISKTSSIPMLVTRERITVFLCDEKGTPKRNFIIEGPGGRLVRTDEEGIAHLDSRWVDQVVIIRDPNDLSVAIPKIIKRKDENVIKIFNPNLKNYRNDINR